MTNDKNSPEEPDVVHELRLPWDPGRSILAVAILVWVLEKILLRSAVEGRFLQLPAASLWMLVFANGIVAVVAAYVLIRAKRIKPRPSYWAATVAMLWSGARFGIIVALKLGLA